MTDAYLYNEFEKNEKAEGISTIYQHSSGFIHLSKKHFLAIFSSEKPIDDEGMMQMQIGYKVGSAMSQDDKLNSINCMAYITSLITKYIKHWIVIKQRSYCEHQNNISAAHT